jgi:iron complex transport system substrate-binding protein
MIVDLPTYFPEFSKLPSIGNRKDMNAEAVFDIGPEAVIIHGYPILGLNLKIKYTSNGIDYIMLRMWESHTAQTSLMTLGYILDKSENAKKYIEYQNQILNEIKKRVATIPEDKESGYLWIGLVTLLLQADQDIQRQLNLSGELILQKISQKNTGTQLPEVDPEW